MTEHPLVSADVAVVVALKLILKQGEPLLSDLFGVRRGILPVLVAKGDALKLCHLQQLQRRSEEQGE